MFHVYDERMHGPDSLVSHTLSNPHLHFEEDARFIMFPICQFMTKSLRSDWFSDVELFDSGSPTIMGYVGIGMTHIVEGVDRHAVS